MQFWAAASLFFPNRKETLLQVSKFGKICVRLQDQSLMPRSSPYSKSIKKKSPYILRSHKLECFVFVVNKSLQFYFYKRRQSGIITHNFY